MRQRCYLRGRLCPSVREDSDSCFWINKISQDCLVMIHEEVNSMLLMDLSEREIYGLELYGQISAFWKFGL